MRPIFLIFYLFLSFSIFGQSGIQQLLDARSSGMGQIGTIHSGSNALLGNPAGLADLSHFTALGVVENRFLAKELQNAGFAVALPMENSAIGIQLGAFGFESYREFKSGLSYARKLSESLSLGGQIIYWNQNIPEYGNSSLLTFKLGLQAMLSEDIRFGVSIYNPIRLEITEGEQTYAILRVGLSYQLSSKVLLASELEKDQDFATRIKLGMDYQLSAPLSLRAGVITAPYEISFGMGLDLFQECRLDLVIRQHEVLGFTPGIGLVYQKK